MSIDIDNLALPAPERRIFCNRTLNMRSMRAVGFDMDYTLIHYRSVEWELRAYENIKQRFAERGWPVEHLTFDPDLVGLGLIMDLELGNLVKANRFGYVTRACHGTKILPFEEQRRHYSRTLVDLAGSRWRFLNTLFSLSEACMYLQLVELLDSRQLEGAMGYADLHRVVRASLDEAHMEGTLKAEIMSDPDRFVELDPELPLALLDQKHAGKRLMLITNSEWVYTRTMMSYAFDRYLSGRSWRDLFDLVIVAARKPAFFTQDQPVFEIINNDGDLRPFHGRFQPGAAYFGGSATRVERDLQLKGEEILYIGDHIFADVRVSKSMLRWRTGLVLRDLEAELTALEAFKPKQCQLSDLMSRKELLEHRYSYLRLQLQRIEEEYGPRIELSPTAIREELQQLRAAMSALDASIIPLATEAGELVSKRWGLLMRAGNDKSHLARQIERSADVYSSRVSNLLYQTPFVYLRSPRGSLPHDSGPSGGT